MGLWPNVYTTSAILRARYHFIHIYVAGANEFLVIMFLKYKNVAMETDQCVSLVQYTYICSRQGHKALPWKHNNVLSLVIFSGGGH